jgi:hypothetical protein
VDPYPDPGPYQNVTDPQHCGKPNKKISFFPFQHCSRLDIKALGIKPANANCAFSAGEHYKDVRIKVFSLEKVGALRIPL